MQIPVRFSNYFVHYPACYAGLLSSYLAPLERLFRFLLRVIARSIFFVFQGDTIARFRPARFRLARFRPAVHSSGLLPPNFFHFYLHISNFCCNFAAQNQIAGLDSVKQQGHNRRRKRALKHINICFIKDQFNLGQLKIHIHNIANVRTVSVNFLRILECMGVQARIDQLSEVHTFYETLNTLYNEKVILSRARSFCNERNHVCYKFQQLSS